MNRACRPLERANGNLNEVRESLYETMWEHAGILRSTQSLKLAAAELANLDNQLAKTGVDANTLAFNMSWHDYLNLQNQILVSQAIVTAAKTRTDSRGAHYLTDNPNTGSLTNSRFTQVFLLDNELNAETAAVQFTRLSPTTSQD